MAYLTGIDENQFVVTNGATTITVEGGTIFSGGSQIVVAGQVIGHVVHEVVGWEGDAKISKPVREASLSEIWRD